MSLVRIDFWALTIRGFSGLSRPSKYFFSVATPLLIHKRDGSSTGTSDALGSTRCPFSAKKSRNFLRISLAFIPSRLPVSPNKKPPRPRDGKAPAVPPRLPPEKERSRSEERRVGKECRYRWWPYR